MKMRKLTAMLTAALTVCASVPVLSASAGGFYAEGRGPQSVEEAVEFLNSEGETFYLGDRISIVKAIEQDMEVITELSGTMEDAKIVHEGYEKYVPIREEPAMPKEQNEDAMHHYHEALKQYEEYKRIVEYNGEEVFDRAAQYYVLAIESGKTGDLKVTVSPKHKATEEGVLKQDPIPSVYTFVKDEDGFRETDIRAWLPDSYEEYQSYLRNNGTFSIHEGETGDQIVICTSTNSSTGASLFFDQTGEPCQQIATGTRGVSMQEMLPLLKAGGGSYGISVYEPTAEGRIEFSVCEGFIFGAGPMAQKKQAYIVKKDGDKFTLQETSSEAHDLNGDGVVTAADAVLLMKHLTGEKSLTDTQMIAADVNRDKRVDATDLTKLMQLVIQFTNQIDPPLIHDEPITTDPVLPYDPTDPIVIDDPVVKPVEQ